MIQNIKNRFNYAMKNNESGDVPIAMIGFIILGIIAVVLIWRNWNTIVAVINGWFDSIQNWTIPADRGTNNI